MNRTENPYLIWRANFLQQIIYVSLFLGALAMFLSIDAHLRNGKYLLVAIELFGFFMVGLAAFNKKMSFVLRSSIYLSIFYITGVSIILNYGMGASIGFVVLMGYTTQMAVLLGSRAANYSLVHLFFTCVVLLFLFHQRIVIDPTSLDFTITIVVTSNAFIFIGLVTFVISKVVNKLKESLMETYDSQMELKNKYEELNIKNELLDQFIYRSAHDMRGPLSSILGLVNITNYDIDDSRIVSDNLHKIVGNVNRLEKYLANIVDFSMTNQMGTFQDYSCVDLGELIEEVFSNFKEIAECELNLNCNEKLQQDPDRLRVIFYNLISNSIQYRDASKERIQIQVACKRVGDEMIIEFSDNGTGIRKEQLHQIFELFYRGDERSEGSGLGLYLVQMTVNNLHGSISVNSTLGVGTTFTITVPVKKEQTVMLQ